ncbi:MAG: UDP-N-acetylmuramoyl-tripeptide--D-alanyl-D-alanine ligase, partial [Fimbriimonas ginsengisoli]|nr:UDP-N-acetylmuramoyl-tripeptide--D-alanyl-D-alanine ligase [Fimbriimonas ginsengisoli]
NLVSALAHMAWTLRGRFLGPVVGVTGSAGKTITKEFVAAALSQLGPVLKTEGNRNTEYTVPLLWAELDETYRSVVVEMAMRGEGQIAHLATLSRPTVGLVTNIGYAHIDLVGSREGIARAKAELLRALPGDGLAVLWQEDEFLGVLRERTKARVATFGESSEADCRIESYRPLGWDRCAIGGVVDGQKWQTELRAVGRHIARDAAAAILAAARLGVDAMAAAGALAGADLPPMRMQIVPLNEATILLDAYNASPPSVIAAIETLAELPCSGRRLAVLGEMMELGDHSEAAHREVGRALALHRLDRVLFVGPGADWAREECLAAGIEAVRLPSASDHRDVTAFVAEAGPGDAVLVKGSRVLELERALEPLLRSTS